MPDTETPNVSAPEVSDPVATVPSVTPKAVAPKAAVKGKTLNDAAKASATEKTPGASGLTITKEKSVKLPNGLTIVNN